MKTTDNNGSPWRLVAIYVMGLVAGAQGGLYLADVFDDGVADWRSGAIALAMAVVGIAFLYRTMRQGKRV